MMSESELEEGLKEAHYHWVLSEVVDLIQEYGQFKVLIDITEQLRKRDALWMLE
jgi:hypothetical protein